VGFEDNVCGSYLFDNFVWRTWGNAWLRAASEAKMGELARKAVQGLAFNNFGRVHHQVELEATGNRTYGECLRLLAGELAKGDTVAPEDAASLLIPMLLMLIHSVCFPPLPLERTLTNLV